MMNLSTHRWGIEECTMGVSENSGVFPPNHPFYIGIFHYFHHPFWRFPLFLETPTCIVVLGWFLSFRVSGLD